MQVFAATVTPSSCRIRAAPLVVAKNFALGIFAAWGVSISRTISRRSMPRLRAAWLIPIVLAWAVGVTAGFPRTI